MITATEDQLKRLRKGEIVDLEHHSRENAKRRVRTSESYPVRVDGKATSVRAVVLSVRRKPGHRVVFVCPCILDHLASDEFLAWASKGEMDSEGNRDYTKSPAIAMDAGAIPPRDFTDAESKRVRAHEKAEAAQDAGELIAAAEDVKAALHERMGSDPEFRRVAGRTIWRVRSELDRLIATQRRKAA